MPAPRRRVPADRGVEPQAPRRSWAHSLRPVDRRRRRDAGTTPAGTMPDADRCGTIAAIVLAREAFQAREPTVSRRRLGIGQHRVETIGIMLEAIIARLIKPDRW